MPDPLTPGLLTAQVGFAWDSADEQKMSTSFKLGRRNMPNFLDLQVRAACCVWGGRGPIGELHARSKLSIPKMPTRERVCMPGGWPDLNAGAEL